MAVVHSAIRLDANPTTVPRPGASFRVPAGRARSGPGSSAGTWSACGIGAGFAAIVIVGIAGGLIVAWLYARGDLVGADARAYWAAVRVWLGGGDPYNPGGTFLPYAYAPWLLPIFLPWALLPWDVAWTVWEGSMVILFAWSFTWAFRRHALATALLIAVLALPLTATLDTGNVTLYLALAIWAAQFTGRWSAARCGRSRRA